MPRTFSLARMMLVITALCLLCGFAVNFPLLSAILIPPLFALLVLIPFARRRVQLIMYVTVGTIAAAFFVGLTVKRVQPVPMTEADRWAAVAAIAIATSVSALTWGGAALFEELVHRYVTPKDERLDRSAARNQPPVPH